MKNRFNWFIACIITVTLLLCVAGCQDFLIQVNSGNAIININLDLSKLIKNARNVESQINGYVLKLFVYDAQIYKDGDREIEKLPLITQTSNKVDITGTVKASLEVGIDKTVIFVGKLFTLNDDNTESEKPLYAGKSEVIKIQPKGNKVHLVLSRDKAEIGFEIELQESHEHTFSSEWSTSLTHHWKGTTCGHNDVMADFKEHSFSDWTTTLRPTEEVAGSKERTCSVCNYKEVVEIANLAHTHKFASDWTYDGTYHWKNSTCDHDVTEGKVVHTFGNWTTTKDPTEDTEGSQKRTCSECNYEDTAVIEKLAHTHKFAEKWSASLTHHWKAATCIHTENVTQFGKHDFGEWTTTKEPTEEETGIRKQVCSDCYYEKIEEIEKNPAGFVCVKAGTFQMGSNDGNDNNKPVHQVTITKSFYMGKYEVTQAEYVKYCTYGEIDPSSSSFGDGGNYPAYYVTWYDTLVYCNKRSMEEGLSPCYSISGNTDPEKWGDVPTSTDTTWKDVVCDWNANGYRLPTEAEWEYAARAGDNTVDSLTYSGTSDVNELVDYAWYYDNSSSKTHEVGTNNANGFGLYDMSGNVYEWCWNWYTDSYEANSEGVSDPTGASSGTSRVFRGGCWKNDSGSCAVSCRNYGSPINRFNSLGFRVVRSAN